MADSKFDPAASRGEFISNAGTTLAAAAVLPTLAAVTTSSAAAAPKTTAAPAAGPEQVGAAGELHQIAGGGHTDLTTNQGVVISDDENSLKIGARGPTSLEDLAGGPSVLFDSILVLTAEAAQTLSMQPAAVGFVSDAYSHL